MNDTATPRVEASSLLASFFFEIVCEEGVDFEDFESRCISLGHLVIADAMSMALEQFDAKLCLDLPDGCKVHDRRGKTLASEVGDLRFKYRRGATPSATRSSRMPTRSTCRGTRG